MIGLGIGAGGDGTQNNFLKNFGSAALTVAQFETSLSGLTNVTVAAIDAQYQFFVKLYGAAPANLPAGYPNADAAARAATFGFAVGTDLANPTLNANLVSQVQNALTLNAETINGDVAGAAAFQPTAALGLQPPRIPLQGSSGGGCAEVDIVVSYKYFDPTLGNFVIKETEGTGFFTDNHTIDTAAHILIPREGAQILSVQITDCTGQPIPISPTGTAMFFANPHYDPSKVGLLSNFANDTGIILLSDSFPQYPKLSVSTSVLTGPTTVSNVGFPNGVLKITQGLTAIPVSTSSDTFLALSADLGGGDSGSPVFDSSGNVVGIVVAGSVELVAGVAAAMEPLNQDILANLAANDHIAPGLVVAKLNPAPFTAIGPGNSEADLTSDPTDTSFVTLIGFQTVNLASLGSGANGIDGLSATNAPGGVTINITGSASLHLGHITGLNNASPTDIGQTTVFVDGAVGSATVINDTGTGILDIGVTDVQSLSASSASNLIMDLPGSGVTTGILVQGSAIGQNLLQGTSGPLTPTVALPVLGTTQAYVGNVGNDQITGGAGADNIFGEGGNDIITLNSASSTVWMGFYDVGHTGVSGVGTLFLQAVTDIVGGAESFTNGYGSATTTINNFALGTSGNVLVFSPGDWAEGNSALSSGGTDFGLRSNTGGFITTGANATFGVVNSPGATPGAGEVTLDNISTYANAAQLLNALIQSGVGNIAFFNTLPAHGIQHELIAYGTNHPAINIADIEFFNNTNAPLVLNTANANTPGNLTITVHDLVDLNFVGIIALENLSPSNIFFHA